MKTLLNYDVGNKVKELMKGGNAKSGPEQFKRTQLSKGYVLFSYSSRAWDLCYLFNLVRPVYGQNIGGINNDASF